MQSFSDSYYIASIAHIYDVNSKNEKMVKTILDSIAYSDTEESGGLVDTPKDYRLPLLKINSYLAMHHDVALGTAAKNDYDEKMENIEADTSYKEASGYDYLKSREIAGYDGQVYTILVPESEDSDNETSYYYYEHGINMSIYVSELYQKDMEDVLDDNDYRIDTYKENKKDFSNLEESDPVIEDDLVYKICTVDALSYDNSTSKETTVIGVIKKDDKDILLLNFQLYERDMDSETEAILKELEKEYNIPLSEYAIDKDKLTYSGKAADFSVENYMYDGNGTEIFEVEGYELLGKTTLTAFGGEAALELLVPMCENAYVFDSHASGKMHGVDTSISFREAYSSFDILDSLESDIEGDQAYIKKNARDYKNVSESALAKDSTDTAVMGSFTYEKIQNDGSSYAMEEILIKLYNDSDKEYYTEIKIVLNQADFNSRTELLLEGISSAYGIDYLKLSEIALKGSDI